MQQEIVFGQTLAMYRSGLIQENRVGLLDEILTVRKLRQSGSGGWILRTDRSRPSLIGTAAAAVPAVKQKASAGTELCMRTADHSLGPWS